MKRILTLFWAACIILPLSAQKGKINIPDLKGYVTLKCDFHIHTVFSDGTVWPTVRVDEAYREGLDAIAVTDHIEYRPRKNDIVASHNRSYEIAQAAAEARNIILIKGSEISRSMPPGHHNALFLTNAEALDKPDDMDVFRAAKAQGAFIFWNHPGWARQQPDTTRWFPEHTQLLEQGMMHGIEVVNGNEYYPEAHRWCMEKSMTMFGNSDIHQPSTYTSANHRPMTLVFARSATPEAIREALNERRTAVYHKEYVIGEEKYLKELFENALAFSMKREENIVTVTVKNKSDLTFHLKKSSHDARLTYFRHNTIEPYTIKPNSKQTFTVRLNDGLKGGDVNFSVENFLTQPNKGMQYTLVVH